MPPSENCCVAGGTGGGRWDGKLASCWKRNVRRRHFLGILIHTACLFMVYVVFFGQKQPQKKPYLHNNSLSSCLLKQAALPLEFALRKILSGLEILCFLPQHSCSSAIIETLKCQKSSTSHCLTFEELRERGFKNMCITASFTNCWSGNPGKQWKIY